VAKSKDQKFIVHTEESVDTEVLGTEFNVKTGRGNIEVYLKEGSVKITSPANHVTLTSGEKATYDKSTRAVTVARSTSTQAEDLLGWMHKVFIYDDEPLDAIVQEIEDYYGVTISFSERSLADRRFTGKIPGQSLDVTLEVLSKTLELSIENKGDEIVIKPLSE
jgi:transmembrane sensor